MASLLTACLLNPCLPSVKGETPASNEHKVVTLTTGHIGVPYPGFKIRKVMGLAAGDTPHCDRPRKLPAGLNVDCATMLISGTPIGSPSEVKEGDDVITVTDQSGDSVEVKYAIKIVAGPDEGSADGTPPASTTVQAVAHLRNQSVPAVAAPAKPLLSVETTSAIDERASHISGTVTASGDKNPTVPSDLKVQLRFDRGNGKTELAELDSSTPATPVFQTPVTNGTFNLKLKVQLTAGDHGTIEFVPASSLSAFDVAPLPSFLLKLDNPRPEVKVTSLIRDGVSTIQGTYSPAPDPAIASDDTKTPPVVGNLPSVVVLVRNPGAPSEEWRRASLTAGMPPVPVDQMEASSSKPGTFAVQLKSPLAAGQAIRVQLVPPQKRPFTPATDANGKSLPNYAEWPDPKEEWPDPKEDVQVVFTSLAIAPPVITSEVAAGTDTIKGSATPSVTNGTAVNIAAISDDSFQDYTDEGEAIPQLAAADGDERLVSNEPVPACINQEAAVKLSERFLPLTLTSGTGAYVATDSTTGNFTVKLATPLIEGQRFHLVELLPANTTLTQAEKSLCKTKISTAKGTLDWGRIHADFVAGVLISNDSANSTTGSSTAGSGNFSQAHQFYALSVEKSWSLPGCYLRVPAPRKKENTDGRPDRDECYHADKHRLYPSRWTQHFDPGFSTYFQTRLTAIPVSTIASTNTTGAGTAGNPTTSATPTSNLLSTAQTARVEVGAYLPFFITRWTFNERPYALFLAPLAKVGFDTVTGPSTVNTISPTGTAQSQTFEQVYNYWSYGARIGHMELTRSPNRAPETLSYLDISFGPYSNLQSYICHSGPKPGFAPATSPTACAEYTDIASAVDSRKRLYRFDIEGLLNIPRTLLYVGLNANIGQKTLGAGHLDQGFAAPNDVRFFFGTKFDIASVLMKFNVGPH